MKVRHCIAVAAAIALPACRPAAPLSPADLVLRSGKVVTLVDAEPEAQAVAVAGYSILAVGSDDEIARHIGPETRVIDLEGRLVIPGFIEGHGHFMNLGAARMSIGLADASSWDEIVERVARAVARVAPGEWIQGRGWHQEKWDSVPADAVQGVPTNDTLSAVSPNNPVLLTHASGHASLANDRAMAEAGITASTSDPAGGTIVRDGAGKPTGMLRETAQRLVRHALSAALQQRGPEALERDAEHQIELAGRESLRHGITTFHDAGATFAEIDRFKRLASEGRLPVRLYVMVRGESIEAMARQLPEYRTLPSGDDFVSVRSIKHQIDGALGSHGAWLIEPYEDMGGSDGLVLETVEQIERTARLAIDYGFQVNTHAIGDRANREVLDIYERAFEIDPRHPDRRWRIEHAQHLHPSDIPRFAALGIIASMQGVHCASDGPWVSKRIGEARARSGAYVWRSLIDSGAIVTNGTDVPVESIDPIANFQASVTRRASDGSVFYGDQKMTREEALRSYTLSNAYAAFEENLKGSLEPGKLADIVVLSHDILTVPVAQLSEARVELTVLGGKIRYQRRPEGATQAQ
jgi:hypothetical protein